MIYYVSKDRLLLADDIEYVTVEEVKEWFSQVSVIQADSETNGLDPWINDFLCFQIGSDEIDKRVVIDCTTIDIALFKDLLESKKLIFHNAKFDLQFLYKHGIIPRKVYDTMIAEQTMYQGFPYIIIGASEYHSRGYDFPYHADPANPGRYSLSFSLAAVSDKYLGKQRDKSIRAEISKRGLDYDVIKYASDDVIDLEKIAKKQLAKAKELGMRKAIAIECGFIPALAYMEWCGVKLDSERWKKKMLADKVQAETAEKELNEFVKRTPALKKFTYIDPQGDLFTGYDLEPKVTIQWSSSKQVIPVAQALGFDTVVKDKKSGKDKDSVLEKQLKIQKGVCDEFLDLYYEKYQAAHKTLVAFGQGHLDAINPITGRLHTKFNQMGASSGRLSCGGGCNDDLAKYKKLPLGSCKLLNLQQLPHDAETRACFVAEPGNSWVSCDFAAEESRLIAEVTEDQEFYDEFVHRSGDTHAMFAWLCYNKQCREAGCTGPGDVKKLAKEWRGKVKPVEFAWGFGASADTIAKTAGISVKEAEDMVVSLEEGFTGITAFKKKAAADVQKNGFIEICPETGHKLWWWDHKKWLETKKQFTREFWDEFKKHKGTGDEIARMVREHFQAADKYGKLGLNSRTQGTGAIIFKDSGKAIFDWIVDHKQFGKIKMCVGVHDEWNLEFPSELEKFPSVLQSIMEKSASKYCHSLPIPAEPEVGDHWIH